ncbi:MAG: hypothetical protein EPN17_11030 [Methylobacter sp.]|nr:MAG: hypothetical protein EPN17_11030 [Methylobacter sp.]
MSELKQIHYYKNIARIRLDLQVVLDDLEYQREGGKIFYAVDNDVIKLYSNPEANSKYARSFDDEDEKDLTPQTYSLAEYIFEHLTGNLEPLLTLPTLKNEFTSILEGMWRDATIQDAKGKSQLSVLEALLAEYVQKPDLDKLVNGMLLNCESLCRVLYLDQTSSPDAVFELDRIGYLVNKNRLVNIEILPWLHKPPTPQSLFMESRDWFAKLQKTKPSQHSLHRNIDDAKSLAYISLVNRSFHESGEQQKLLFLTGDEAIHKIFGNVGEENKEIPVRHPSLYLSFTKLLADSGSKEDLQENLQEFKQLLDAFLSPFMLISGDNDKYISLLTIFLKNEKKEAFKNLIAALGKEEKDLMVAYGAIKDHRSRLLNIAALSQNIHSKQDKLKSWLNSHINKNTLHTDLVRDIDYLLRDKWDSAYTSLKKIYLGIGTVNMAISVSLDLHDETAKIAMQKNWQRMPVALVSFDANGESDNLFESIRDALYKKNYPRVLRSLEDMGSLGKIYLVSAMIAAEAGAWEKTKEFCENSLEYADDEYTLHEAYYFYAVAIRHSCNSCQEFQRAVSFLEQAINAWEKTHNELDSIAALRFKAEKYAQIMAYYNYKQFLTDWEQCDEPCEKDSLEDAWAGLLNLSETLDNLQSEDEISARLKRQVYTNICSLFLFASLINKKNYCVEDVARKHLNNLSTLTKNDKNATSYYIEVIIALSEYALDREYGHKSASNKQYQQLKRTVEKCLSYPRLLPYEEAKFNYLLNILNA